MKRTKRTKRNAVIVTILLFVCAAVYLNWSYNKKWGDDVDSAMGQTEDDAMIKTDVEYLDALLGADTGDRETETYSSVSEYFASARLNRQQSRDEAIAMLQVAAALENASQETIDSAVNEITVMAEWTMKEGQLENMLLAKDFVDCVVFINNDNVMVAVPASDEGLSTAEVAKITEIITEGTGYDVSNLNIVPVKE